MSPYDVVAALEERVAEYSGAPYAVACDSCTNALLLSLKYRFWQGYEKVVSLPKHTYVGVAYAVVNAGGVCEFHDEPWEGAYELKNVDVIDSARRFTSDMFVPGTLYCLSAHWGKHLKIGRGGFVLTDDIDAATVLRRMRFDGRCAGVPPSEDKFLFPGFHCYMLPEEAARGLMLMNYMPSDNADLPWDNYPDLSKFQIFTRQATRYDSYEGSF